MTVTIDQALNGLERFANSELIPRLPEGIGVAAAILMRMAKDGGKERLLAMKDNFFVQLDEFCIRHITYSIARIDFGTP